MAVTGTVPIDIARGTQFAARKLSDGLLKENSATIKVQYVKQSSPVEYWNGSAWVTADPGPQSMTQDTTVSGVYEDACTYDEAGVDYIVTAWDSADADVEKVSARVRGILATEDDGTVAITCTIKETDTNGDPIPDVIVSVRNANGDEISRDSTNSNGIASGLRCTAAGTYTVVPALGSWTFNNETMTVSTAEVTAGVKAVEYYGTEFDEGSPAAGYSRIYGWLREVELGTAIQDQRIRVRIIGKPYADADHVYYDHENSQVTPNSEGYWYLDMLQGVTAKFFSVRLSDGVATDAIDRTVVVPAANAALASLAEASIA